MRNDLRSMIQHAAAFFTILAVLSPHPAFADKASRLNKRGIEQYRNSDAQESVQSFTDALVERPDSPELRFNRGTALSSIGNAEEAVSELDRSAAAFTIPASQAAAHFNAGNTLAVSGNLDAAIEQYRQAVTLDQSSSDYRKNLEMALRQKKQQEQQQKDGDKNQQEKQNQDKQDQQQENQNKQEQKKQPETKQSEQNKQQNQQQDARPMSPEEAQQLLDAMKDEESKAFELRRMMMQEALKPGDDW